MDVMLASLITLYIFSTGRRIFALQQVRDAAATAGLTALAKHCDTAIASDLATREMEARWAGDKDAALYAPEAKQIDILVDVALGALRDAINAEARDAAPGDDLGDAAGKLEKEAFPEGVAAITTMRFPDELSQVQRIIALLQSAEWDATAQKLGLGRRLARLVDLEKQYRAALAVPVKTVSFGEVKDARAAGQSLMLQAVAMILGLYPSDGDADVASRKALLAPILRQNEAIRDYLRARKAVEDVNPSTGQVDGGAASAQGGAAAVEPAPGAKAGGTP